MISKHGGHKPDASKVDFYKKKMETLSKELDEIKLKIDNGEIQNPRG